MKVQQRYFILLFVLSLISLLTLTGCPWGGMKYYPAEKTSAWMKNNEICFSVPDSKDYQPVFIAINLRDTPSKNRQFTDLPALRIAEGKLCIPPSYYHFPDTSENPFIVEFVLQSQDESNHPRSFVAGFEMFNGRPHDVPLTKREYDAPEPKH